MIASLTPPNELEEWVARASEEVGKQSSEGNHAYLHIGFTTRHSLAYHPYISEPVVAKMVDGYISNVNETELQCTRTATGAMVFASTKEAEEKIGAWAKHYNVQYVKYSTVCTPKPFAIQVAGGSRVGYFIAKRTARRIFFTPNAENARRFRQDNGPLQPYRIFSQLRILLAHLRCSKSNNIGGR